MCMTFLVFYTQTPQNYTRICSDLRGSIKLDRLRIAYLSFNTKMCAKYPLIFFFGTVCTSLAMLSWLDLFIKITLMHVPCLLLVPQPCEDNVRVVKTHRDTCTHTRGPAALYQPIARWQTMNLCLAAHKTPTRGGGLCTDHVISHSG